MRSQVTLAKRFTTPLSPVSTTLSRGRAHSWFATLACCLETLYSVEVAENDTVYAGVWVAFVTWTVAFMTWTVAFCAKKYHSQCNFGLHFALQMNCVEIVEQY